MRTVRMAAGAAGALLLAGGYFASQFAYFFGDRRAYARALDASSVPMVALGLLAAAIVLCLLPEGPEGST